MIRDAAVRSPNPVVASQAGMGDVTTERSPAPPESLRFHEVDLFPEFAAIRHGELFALRLTNNTTEATHAIHRFPAKFVPQVPRWALAQFGGDEATVLDPFMGSGTTLVEVLLTGGRGIGIDIDPIARLIARAKTGAPLPERIRELGTILAAGWRPASRELPPMSDLDDFEHWFSASAWRELSGLLSGIDGLTCSDSERRFLLTIFSSILRRVSNADDQSHKTYVSGTLPKYPPNVRETFEHSYQRALRSLEDLHKKRQPDAEVAILDEADARSMMLPERSVDLIVTSPPYLDSVDYMYNFMLEYFWLGPRLGVDTRQTFNVRRRDYVGSKSPIRESSDMPAEFYHFISTGHISESRRRATIAYLSDMAKHFKEASRVLRWSGRYVLVIGNSQTRSSILPVHDCLIWLASQEGLVLEKAFGYRVRRHYMKFPRAGKGGIILIDWVIVLRKNGGTGVDVRSSFLPLPWITLGADAVAH